MNKKSIREKYKSMRFSLSKASRMNLSEQIDYQFKELNLSNIKIVHHYLAVEEQQEIATDGIVKMLRESFQDLLQVVPVMKQQDMISVLYEEGMTVQLNEWGIREPIQEILIDEHSIDCVLTPLLAFDKKGNRVGYGKGCYDRFFTKCRTDVIKIGFSYFPPVDNIQDTDKFDIPLNFCITPDRIYEFG
jgi:5-formyltetrahydrofolate cyclo-ligase